MHNRIIASTQIKSFIKDVLSDEKTRHKNISKVSLEEVNAYIDWIDKVCPYIVTAFEEFDKLSYKTAKGIENNEPIDFYSTRTYREDYPQMTKYYDLIQTIAPQYKDLGKDIELKLIELSNELLQQKRYHEKNTKQMKILSQKVLSNQLNKIIEHFEIEKKLDGSKDALDENEQEMGQNRESKKILNISQSIKDAQDSVALQALETLDEVTENYRESASKLKELELKFATLEKQKMQDDKLLESSLSKTEQLQIDVRNLQTQLAEAREQSNHFKMVANNIQNTATEQKKEYARLIESKKVLEEQNTNLLLQLKSQQEAKAQTTPQHSQGKQQDLKPNQAPRRRTLAFI